MPEVLRHLLFTVRTKEDSFTVCVCFCECVCPCSSSGLVFSLLIVTITATIIACLASSSAKSLALPFWCSFITVAAPAFISNQHSYSRTHTHKLNQNLARACQRREILIHCVRTGLFFSLAPAITTAKAQQPNNASSSARRHTEVLEMLHLLRGGRGWGSILRVRLKRWCATVHVCMHPHTSTAYQIHFSAAEEVVTMLLWAAHPDLLSTAAPTPGRPTAATGINASSSVAISQRLCPCLKPAVTYVNKWASNRLSA